jgi:hypothetical protein
MAGNLCLKVTDNSTKIFFGGVVYQTKCEPRRKRKWDDVTVSAWIPANLCTKLDLLAMRLKITRRQALEIVLCSILNEKDFLFELEKTLLRES